MYQVFHVASVGFLSCSQMSMIGAKLFSKILSLNRALQVVLISFMVSVLTKKRVIYLQIILGLDSPHIQLLGYIIYYS